MVEILSLGCRLNIAESETLRGLLGETEHLVVVNSCAVTAEAVRQTRQTIRRARRRRPDARLLVTGCAAEIEREMLAGMAEVDGLVANIAKLDPRAYCLPGEGSGHDAWVNDAGNDLTDFARAQLSRGYTRAFVQIQNGCDHACTFCVIPQGRGPSHSRGISEVIADVARHLEDGAQEVVLTGVDITSWGNDLPGEPRLGALAFAILDAFPHLERLRLSSIDGAEIDEALFELLAGERRLMPHLHLSLQSGDDMILKRMKRRHSRRDAIALVERLRARRREIAIGADIIAGFPTEDEVMHANSLSIIAELGIVHGHIFPYSPRPGTPAARMPQVEQTRIRSRAAELRAAVAEQRQRWLKGLVGKRLQVLAERDGTGHSETFAPVRLPADATPGKILTITPNRITEAMLA